MSIDVPSGGSGQWWAAKTNGMSFNFTVVGIIGVIGLIGSILLVHLAPRFELEQLVGIFDSIGYYVVTGFGLLIAWDMWPRGVKVGIEKEELVVQRHRTVQRFALADARLRFGKYDYPKQGTLGTILYVGRGSKKLRIGGMGVTLSEEHYKEPPSSNLDLTMDAEPFEDLRKTLTRRGRA